MKQPKKKQQRHLYELLAPLVFSDLAAIGRLLLKIVRLSMINQRAQPDTSPKVHPVPPSGPYIPRRPRNKGDLLLFVPRHINSLLIDDFTGGYGYSHVALDCGQSDLITGRPVMVESMMGTVVKRMFQNEYGSRPFARIPLSQTGIDVDALCKCANGKLGEPYDNIEALTWGAIDDPAKQICSDLVSVCLPEAMRKDIGQAAKKGFLRRHSVSVHSLPSTHGINEFISPNGFAEYFGAPPGKKLRRPNETYSPRIVSGFQLLPVRKRPPAPTKEQPPIKRLPTFHWPGILSLGSLSAAFPFVAAAVGAAALAWGAYAWLNGREAHFRPAALPYTPQPASPAALLPASRIRHILALPESAGHRPA